MKIAFLCDFSLYLDKPICVVSIKLYNISVWSSIVLYYVIVYKREGCVWRISKTFTLHSTVQWNVCNYFPFTNKNVSKKRLAIMGIWCFV